MKVTIDQLALPLRKDRRIPLLVSNGIGVNSIALISYFVRMGYPIDRITNADTGGEKQETYDYHPYFDEWLAREGYPTTEVVYNIPKNFKNWPPYYSLEDNCLTNGTLPSLAFGFKSCSQKWKIAPQDRLIKEWDVAQEVWAEGEKLIKCIGYDAGPADIRRRDDLGDDPNGHYTFRYPLIELGWDRLECIRQIKSMGLKVPPKSSCFFCPAMRPPEVKDLPIDKLERIVTMEARAMPRLKKIKGLWREGLSLKRSREAGYETKIENMTDYIRREKLLTQDRILELQQAAPRDIVRYQQGYALAKANGTLAKFVDETPDDYRHN